MFDAGGVRGEDEGFSKGDEESDLLDSAEGEEGADSKIARYNKFCANETGSICAMAA